LKRESQDRLSFLFGHFRGEGESRREAAEATTLRASLSRLNQNRAASEI